MVANDGECLITEPNKLSPIESCFSPAQVLPISALDAIREIKNEHKGFRQINFSFYVE